MRVDPDRPSLPVVGTGTLSGVRKSRRSKWRASVLVLLHLVIAAHATHFLVAGRTLSPVEPSESMYTLELGQVNAGFVFFAAALLATLVFGRFVCGWGCHLVALQDLCGWIMKRLGVRPRPFRSRLLLWAPMAVALYMFAWPSLRRLFLDDSGAAFPGFTNHLVTTGFWDTFPGPVFAVLTFLTCGFAAVYLLGAKGFCTYACPYGALFAVADRLSPGRIVVNDDCTQSGHCTVTCTSNVRVHEEVRLYGRVVDPGCMKCMDCVSVCPNEALSFSFARPSVLRGRPAGPRRDPRYALGTGAEVFLGVVALVATLSFRGLYDGPPLLMSVALGGLTAFVALKLWHLARRPSVSLQNLELKNGGAMRAGGRWFLGLAVIWLLFTAHSGYVQWHRAWGRYYLNRTEASRSDVLRGAHRARVYSERHRTSASRSFAHFSSADRAGLFDVVEVKLGLAWGHLLAGEPEAAERAIRQAIAIEPANAELWSELLDLLIGRGRLADAVEAQRRRLQILGPDAAELSRLGALLAETGEYEKAVEAYRECLRLGGETLEVRYNLGGLLRRLGRPGEAVAQLEAARKLAPDDADTCVELGLAYMATGRNPDAIRSFRRAIELNPESPESRGYLPGLIRRLERGD